MRNVFLKIAQLALGSLVLLGVPAARADLQSLAFSGGDGAPLTITFSTPIYFEVTTEPVGSGPGFVIAGLGDFFDGGYWSAGGTVTYSINGGTPYSFTTINSGYVWGDIAAADTYFFNLEQVTTSRIHLDDRILLSAGTLTTTASLASSAPADGTYDMFIMDAYGALIGTGVAVPEPATTAAWFGGIALVGAAFFRRRLRGN